MTTKQMELELAGRQNFRMPSRQRRAARGQWWFAQMRQLVDRALDWQPKPPPRPEQIWFPE